MPVEKALRAEDLPAGSMDVEVDDGPMPDVNITFDTETGGVVIDMGEDDAAEVPFDSNLAEVIP